VLRNTNFDDALTVPVAIALCGVDEIAAEVKRVVQCGDRILVRLSSKSATHSASTEADFGNFSPEATEGAKLYLEITPCLWYVALAQHPTCVARCAGRSPGSFCRAPQGWRHTGMR
jgi:hypothetical protein